MNDAQYAGALLVKPELYWQTQVSPDDMIDAPSRKVVRTVGDMLREGIEVDVVSVANRAKLPIQVVGNLARDCYAPSGAFAAAEAIKAEAIRRRAVGALRDAVQAIADGAEPHLAIQSVNEEITPRDGGQVVSIAEAVKQAETRETKPPIATTQIPKLNDNLKLNGGKLVTVAGRPGNYKSTLALHIARYNAVRNVGVGMFSLEMDAAEIGERFKAQGSGNLDIPLWIDYTSYSLTKIEAQIIQWAQRDSVKLVVIDYLLLIDFQAPKGTRKDEAIGIITRRLKQLAMRLGIVILLVTQLNRQNEIHNRRPILSDLRDSGNIEQDSDAVLFTHRWEKETGDEFELLLAKNRGGPSSVIIGLHIQPERYRVMEATK